MRRDDDLPAPVADGAVPAMLLSTFSQANEIVELIVLTTDETFMRTLREAVDGARRLWHVTTGDKVADLLVAGQVGILVLDVEALLEVPSVFVTQIKAQFPELVIVVAGRREAENSLIGLISAGVVYRFIHKPMSPGRARSFADAAVRKHLDQRKSVPKPLRSAALPRRMQLPPAGVRVAAGVGAVVAVGALAWLGHRWSTNRSAAPPAAHGTASAALQEAAPGTPHPALTEQQQRELSRAENALLEERLDEAGRAIDSARQAGVESGRIGFLSGQLAPARARQRAATARLQQESDAHAHAARTDEDRLSRSLELAAERTLEGRLIEPDGDSAKYYVQLALKAAPNSSVAQASRETLALNLLAAAHTAIERREFSHAVSLLEGANGIASQSNIDRVLQMLRAARRQADADAWNDLLTNGLARLREDRLIEPPNDNAWYYLSTLRKVDPQNAGLGRAVQDLGQRLVAKGRLALTLNQADAARSWFDSATEIGYSSGELDAALRDLNAGASRAADPATVVDAGRLTLLQSVRPAYPRKAEESNIEGWVELEFTVAESGAVTDVSVQAAQPSGIFDAAAVRALSQWRYKPVLRDARPVAQRAKIRMRFTTTG